MDIEELHTLAKIAGQTQQDDLADALGHVRLVELAADQARRQIVQRMRDNGETWEYIGDVLGVSKQAAQYRFSR